MLLIHVWGKGGSQLLLLLLLLLWCTGRALSFGPLIALHAAHIASNSPRRQLDAAPQGRRPYTGSRMPCNAMHV
jgi:hypothetical protein